MNISYIYDYVMDNTPDDRKTHILGVVKMAKELARIYGADEKKAEIAALCHDLYKNISLKDSNALILEAGLGEKYIDNKNLAHGKLAAFYLPKLLNIDDVDILNSISFHTTGREHMSLLEKIIYISDSCEESRTYKGAKELRSMAKKSLDMAVLLSLEKTVNLLQSKGIVPDEDTLNAITFMTKSVKL